MKTQIEKDQDDIVYKEAFNVVKANFLRRIEEAREKENPEKLLYIALDAPQLTEELSEVLSSIRNESTTNAADILYRLMKNETDLNRFIMSVYTMVKTIEDIKKLNTRIAMIGLHGMQGLNGIFKMLDEEFKKHLRDEDSKDDE